jgi:hypothetical protein
VTGSWVTGQTVTGAPFRADRVYLGWEYAPQYPDPGPPPPDPSPPGPQRLDPGWLAAQHREERRLSRPARLGGALSLALAGLTGVLGALGLLNASLTATGIGCFLVLAGFCARDVWRGARVLHAAVAAEERRVARARAVQEAGLAGWQDEHARQQRDWQARGHVFRSQLQWYGVALPAGIDRIDVAGGTLAGWSALVTMLAGLRLAAGGAVTVLDFSAGAVAQDLLAVAHGRGIDPLVWVLPGDLPRLDLGAELPGAALADVLAVAATAAGDPATPADPAPEHAILERIAGVLGEPPSIARLAAGLRVLAQVGSPGEDVRRGLISDAQAEAISGLYGQAAADRVIIERALALEAKLRTLASLGSARAALPASRLRVVAVDRAAGVADAPVLAGYVTAALTQLLRGEPPPGVGGQRWRHTVVVCGAEKLRGELLDRLCDACESTGTGLVLAYRSLPAHVRERLGRGHAAAAFMRLGNTGDAKVASEQIGTEHRFVVAQLTDSVGASVTETAGQAYTSTVGTASSVSLSTSRSETTGQSGGGGRSWSGWSAFAPRTGSVHDETSYSVGLSGSVSTTGGLTAGTSWGWQTAQAVGTNNSLARTSQRTREFLVEPHELQQLPPSALIVSYPSPAGRRVVLADANPGILGLPAATLRGRDEDGPALAMASASMAGAGGTDVDPFSARGPIGAGPPAAFGNGGGPDRSGDAGRFAAPAASYQDTQEPLQPTAARWAGPIAPPSRDPADAPVSWRADASPVPGPDVRPDPPGWWWRTHRRRREH